MSKKKNPAIAAAKRTEREARLEAMRDGVAINRNGFIPDKKKARAKKACRDRRQW